MGVLRLDPNLADPDGFYQHLIDTHRDLTAEQSEKLNARLILILSNHIGDMEILKEALRVASEDVGPNTSA